MAEEEAEAQLAALVAALSLSDAAAPVPALVRSSSSALALLSDDGAAGGGDDDDADLPDMAKLADLFGTLRALSLIWRSRSEDVSSPPLQEEAPPAAAGGAGPPLAQPPPPPSSSSSDYPEPSPVMSLVPEIAAADPMAAVIPTFNIGVARELVRAPQTRAGGGLCDDFLFVFLTWSFRAGEAKA